MAEDVRSRQNTLDDIERTLELRRSGIRELLWNSDSKTRLVDQKVSVYLCCLSNIVSCRRLDIHSFSVI